MLFDTVLSIFVFIVVIGIVVTIHELGHLIVARWCGVHVEVFSFGFGRELVGFTDRHGTRWQIAPIPLGGYVSMPSEENSVSPRVADLWRHALITIGGPAANYVFAVAGFSVLYWLYGVTVPVPATVDQLMDALTTGKRIVEYPSILESVRLSVAETWNVTREMLDYLVNLVMARAPVDKLVGPVGIAHISGQAVSQAGFMGFVRLTLLISVALGFFNALPLPPLDGGRLVMYAIGWISNGRSKRFEMPYLLVGWVLMLGLFVVVTWNDVWRLFR